MVTKILALVIIGAALTSSTNGRTISMEKDSTADVQKAFFHPFFPPGLGHGISFGGGKVPGFGGGQAAGFPSGPGVFGGGIGVGFSGTVGSSRDGDRFGSSNGETVVGGGFSGSGVLGEEDAAGSGKP